MPLFTTEEDTDLASEMEDDLTDTCIIYQVVSTNTANGPHRTRTARGPAQPCAYGVLTGQELVRAQQVAGDAQLAVTFSRGTMVAGTDELEITDGVTSEVINAEVVYTGKATRATWLGIYAKNLKA